MKVTKQNPASKPGGLLVALLLAVILSVLFCKSFLPDFVHFSNDGPLGAQNSAWLQLPGAMTGLWDNLNDIGSNAGAMTPDVTTLLRLMLGPVGIAKFLVPIALFILGLGAWTFFRQLKLSPLAAVLGALATTLNSAYFGTACWGVATQQIAIGMDFFALALVVSNTSETPALIRWARLALAGLAVGINVMEAADIGAIFSMLVAIFVFFKAVADESGPALVKAGRGIIRVAMIALFAGFIAIQTVVTLVGTQIQGVVGTGQDMESKAQHWDWATQWSYPKTETLGLFVPGVFGYKYDTPKDMMEFLRNSYQGGVYWGLVGCDPSWDSYFANGEKGTPGQGIFRFAGEQDYAGILVVLVALWAVAQSLRRRNSAFPETQRRFIWFWALVLTVSLLLAWGRFAPFYKFLYMLPYSSTIRNPAKFVYVFSWAMVILFAYGVHALNRRHLETPATGSASLPAQLKNWWAKTSRFDRNWTWFCLLAFVVSVLAWMVYAAEKPDLVRYLQKAGFPDEETAKQMAAFSVGQVSWFIVLFALAIGLCLLVLAGVFAGKRARFGGLLLGVFLVADLGRADLPYITHWNYKQKYASNPIIDFLRDKPYEHRVAGLPFRAPQQFALFEELYRIEWMQHHFPYYNIQSLDVVQRPRLSADLEAYDLVLVPDGTPGTVYLFAPHWQLTNTRYLLGPAGFLDVLNEQLDPLQHRFRVIQRFDITLKPGVEQFTKLEELTAVPGDNGALALFEFTGALPRAKLYTDWQTNSVADLKNFTTNSLDEADWRIFSDAGTNGFLTLKKLASPSFDPQRTVLLPAPLPEANPSAATNQNSGTVEFKSYAPKDIVLAAQADAPSVLLLNDKYDPHWSVTVDGKPAELLRCNFIMRGVYLTPGAHTVEFRFSLPNGPLYVTLTAMGAGFLLCGFLIFSTRRNARPAT